MAEEGTGKVRRRRSTIRLTPEVAVVPDARPEDTLLPLKRIVADRLLGTRAEFQEALTCYSVRVQGILAQVSDVLSEDTDSLGDPERRLRERSLRRALDRLESMDLKPSKGRRKDLKAVEALATILAAEFADW